jgi:hypothetical protein
LPDWHLDLQRYREKVEPTGIPESDRPGSCLRCGQSHQRPHRHDDYSRTVHTVSESVRILIFRFFCPICKKAFSIIPTFLEPYQQVSLDLQDELLQAYEEGASAEVVAQRTDTLPMGSREEKTIRRWSQGWRTRLAQMEKGLWTWLLLRIPHLQLPRDGSLWLVFSRIWGIVRQHFPAFGSIRFLHGLNRLSFSMTVTGPPPHPTEPNLPEDLAAPHNGTTGEIP